mgnify:CR=1 FL=1
MLKGDPEAMEVVKVAIGDKVKPRIDNRKLPKRQA